MTVRYQVDLEDAGAHMFRVSLRLPAPAAIQRLHLPTWIPGSYLIREFSRHLSDLTATQGRRRLEVKQIDKASWQVQCTGRVDLVLRWRVYAFDRSVRAAFLDAERAFFNGTSLFLCAEGRQGEAHEVTLGKLPAGWDIATAMNVCGPQHYRAATYDELIDHPFELGRFWRGRFSACGVPHEFVVSGAWPSFDGERLLGDARRICEQQIRFWHGAARGGAPFGKYVFLLHAIDDGHGGLEHRASTALAAARRDLPKRRMEGMTDGYAGLLGLISHEYFHAWNVKRLQPAEFVALDLSRESYTRLLWFFEGFTSYYDDLMLLRAGLIDLDRYLRLLARAFDNVMATPGRRVQSLADASFDAWIKHYRSDENTPNATVSYYQKGALVALAFDLELRRCGGSLDAVMRLLWQRSGGGPIGHADIEQAMADVAGRPLDEALSTWVLGTVDPPLPDLIADFGIGTRAEPASFAAALGMRLSEGPVTGVQVTSVLHGSAAAAAGVSAGDELLAVDGWRLRRLDDALGWIDREQPFDLLLSRDRRLLTLRLDPGARDAAASKTVFQSLAKPGRLEAARRRAWIDG